MENMSGICPVYVQIHLAVCTLASFTVQKSSSKAYGLNVELLLYATKLPNKQHTHTGGTYLSEEDITQLELWVKSSKPPPIMQTCCCRSVKQHTQKSAWAFPHVQWHNHDFFQLCLVTVEWYFPEVNNSLYKIFSFVCWHLCTPWNCETCFLQGSSFPLSFPSSFLTPPSLSVMYCHGTPYPASALLSALIYRTLAWDKGTHIKAPQRGTRRMMRCFWTVFEERDHRSWRFSYSHLCSSSLRLPHCLKVTVTIIWLDEGTKFKQWRDSKREKWEKQNNVM